MKNMCSSDSLLLAKTISDNTEMHKVDRNASNESRKPRHVRKLNFGQSILTLERIRQFNGQKDSALSIQKNATNISYTNKSDFMRKWIETDNNRVFDSEKASDLSPVLSLPITEPVSPILGNQRKRARGKSSLNHNAIRDMKYSTCANKSESTVNNEVFNISVERSKRTRIDSDDKKENIRKNLFNSQSPTTSFDATNDTTSPILGRSVSLYRKSRQKLKDKKSQRKALNHIQNNYIETDKKSPITYTKVYASKKSPILCNSSYFHKQKQRKENMKDQIILNETDKNFMDLNMNSINTFGSVTVGCMKNKWEILCDQKQCMLLKHFEDNFQDNIIESISSKESKISENSMESVSSTSEAILNIEDSPKDVTDIAKLDIIISNDDDDDNDNNNDNYKQDSNIYSDTGKNSSDHIEDSDTQDTIIKNHNRVLMHNVIFPVYKSPSLSSQASDKDSDETFFSKAEQQRCSNSDVHSRVISQISTQIKDITNSIESSQIGVVISTGTSPQKLHTDTSVQLTLLDSAKKKRRKPKRGSLVERLQSTISAQVSFVRIWKHQLKQAAKQSTPIPCVTIHVQACVARFNRQFLEGVVIDDSFNLLLFKEESNLAKFIKIMTIPDIAGKVQMKSEGVVQIFPPWETLDDRELFVNATYIRVVPDSETDVQQCKPNLNLNRSKRLVVKEFDCPCISANKIVLTCNRRLNKPNAIEKLFVRPLE